MLFLILMSSPYRMGWRFKPFFIVHALLIRFSMRIRIFIFSILIFTMPACIVQSASANGLERKYPVFRSPVKVVGTKFVQDGHEVILNGINYFPAYFPAHFTESWLNEVRYRPETIEDDLKTIANLGFNLVSIHMMSTGDSPSTKTCLNISDFLNRAQKYGLLVNMYIGTSSLLPISDPSRLAILPKVCGLAGNPALFAYDIAWEPHFGGEKERKSLQGKWLAWLKSGYTTFTEVDRIFGGNHDLPLDKELCSDTPNIKVAAFRRFLDDVVNRNYRDVRFAIRSVDATHLIGVRSGYGGNGSKSHCIYAPVDLRAGVKHLDFVSPEAYALSQIDFSELMYRGQFTTAYADVGKPIFWAEYGTNTDGSCKDCNENVQVNFFLNMYTMMRSTGSNGGAGWWFVGIRPQSHADNEKSDFGIIYDYIKKSTARDAFDEPLRDGELSLCSAKPTEYLFNKVQEEEIDTAFACPSKLKPYGRFKLALGKDQLKSDWLTLCGIDNSALLAVIHDDNTGESFQCPQGYASAGAFKPEPIIGGTGLNATDAFGRSISSGWLALCSNDKFTLLKRTRNEMSGRNAECPTNYKKSGKFKPALLPVFRPVAYQLKNAFIADSIDTQRIYSRWITIDRDNVAGDWKMYDIGTQAYAMQKFGSFKVGVKTVCSGTTSKVSKNCVGNTPNNGTCPPKCLNAEIISVEIKNLSGHFQSVANGDSVNVSANVPIHARLLAGNIGEGKWLTQGSAAGVSGAVFFGCNENIGDLKCRKSISADTERSGNSASGEFVIINKVNKKTSVVFQMLSENIAWFGEQINIILVPH